MSSPVRSARLAGALFFLFAMLGVFAEIVRVDIYVPGDAAATAGNIAAEPDLFRLAFLSDLVQMILFLMVAFVLYRLLRHVHADAARAMVVFVALGVGITLLNLVFQFAALLVATDASYASALGTDGSNALVLLLVDMHHYGYLIAQVFFGLWLLPLGYLALRSRMFPRPLAVLLLVDVGCQVVDMLGSFVAPESWGSLTLFVMAPAVVAEFWLIGYLLVRGVRLPLGDPEPVRVPA
jgi:hypothetical protein